jgi:hypothetical protein
MVTTHSERGVKAEDRQVVLHLSEKAMTEIGTTYTRNRHGIQGRTLKAIE